MAGLALFAGLIAGVPAATAASHPTATCGDANDTGVLYETDSGFAAIDDAPSPPPENGTVRNATTVRMGNLTLRADGNASVRVEDATGTPCLAAVNATVPIRVAVDGGPTATVEGTASRLALGPVAVGDGTADLAYAADAGLDVTLRRTGLARGTTVEATDGSGATLTTATAGEDGRLALGLPAATANVSLAVADEGTATDTGTPPGDAGTPTDATPVPDERRTTVGANGSGTPATPGTAATASRTPSSPGGEPTGTAAATAGTATTAPSTGTTAPSSGTTTAPSTGTSAPAGSEGTGDGDGEAGAADSPGGTDTTTGDGPGLGILMALVAVAATGALLRRR